MMQVFIYTLFHYSKENFSSFEGAGSIINELKTNYWIIFCNGFKIKVLLFTLA